MGGEGVQARSPLCRTEPSARGVAPAMADAARPATGGRAARPQDATAQADGRTVRCESPKARIVNRPPSSFSHSGTATGGSARTSATRSGPSARRTEDPGLGGGGLPPLRRPRGTGFRRSRTPPIAPKTARSIGAASPDRLHHGPRRHRQQSSRHDPASTPFPWLDHPPRGGRVPRPGARNRG